MASIERKLDVPVVKPNKGRLFGLDMRKAVAILMVIALHTPLFQPDFFLSNWPESTAIRIFQYCLRVNCEPVPFFVFINGYLMFRAKNPPLKKHWKRILNFFLILIIWSSILILTGLYLEGTPITLHVFFSQLFKTQISNHYNGVLWFLINLIALYLIFPVLKLIFDKSPKNFTILFLLSAFFTIFLNFLGLLGDIIECYRSAGLYRDFLGFLHRFDPFGNQMYLFYFLLGGMLFLYQAKFLKNRWKWVMAGFASMVFASVFGILRSLKKQSLYNPGFNYSQCTLTLYILGTFALFYPWKGKIPLLSHLLSCLGSSTLGIYVIHYIYVQVAKSYFDYLTLPHRFQAYLFVVACSCICTASLSYIDFLRPLIRKKYRPDIALFCHIPSFFRTRKLSN